MADTLKTTDLDRDARAAGAWLYNRMRETGELNTSPERNREAAQTITEAFMSALEAGGRDVALTFYNAVTEPIVKDVTWSMRWYYRRKFRKLIQEALAVIPDDMQFAGPRAMATMRRFDITDVTWSLGLSDDQPRGWCRCTYGTPFSLYFKRDS